MMHSEGLLCSIHAYVRGSCCYGRMSSMSQTLPESSVDRYPFTRPASRPPVVVETDGVELILEDGERVIDAAGGAVVTNIGTAEEKLLMPLQPQCGQLTTWFRHGQRRTGSLSLIGLLTTGFQRDSGTCTSLAVDQKQPILRFELLANITSAVETISVIR